MAIWEGQERSLSHTFGELAHMVVELGLRGTEPGTAGGMVELTMM